MHKAEGPKQRNNNTKAAPHLKKIKSFNNIEECFQCNKFQMETTNAYIQSNQKDSPLLQISEQPQNGTFEEIYSKSHKIQAQINSEKEEFYLLIGDHEHPICFRSIQAFQCSYRAVVGFYEMKKEKGLGIKIILLSKNMDKNPMLKMLLDKTLQEYSDLKYQRITKQLTEKQKSK